jgi:hypothetical protein
MLYHSIKGGGAFLSGKQILERRDTPLPALSPYKNRIVASAMTAKPHHEYNGQ